MSAEISSNKRFNTVIFDMDGVIIDSERLYDIADAEVLRRRNIEFNRENFVSRAMGKSFVESTRLFMEVFGVSGELESVMNERRTVLLETYASDLTFIDGFLGFYKELTRNGTLSCVATACEDKTLYAVDQKLGLTQLFGKNIYKLSDVGNKSKPDPAIFLYAAERMGSAPNRCAVIEDSPNGVLAGKNAGMYCIGLTSTHKKAELMDADMIVDSFQEIHPAFFGGA